MLPDQLKLDVKKEIIDYYDEIKFAIDIKAQELLLQLEPMPNTYNECKELLKLNLQLINRVECILNQSMIEINYFFEKNSICKGFFTKINAE